MGGGSGGSGIGSGSMGSGFGGGGLERGGAPYGGGLGSALPGGSMSSLFSPASGQDEGNLAAAMRFQSLGGGTLGQDAVTQFIRGASGVILGADGGVAGGMGIPIALAAASPLVALLGKTIQKRER